ncbi:MAG: dTDP-4-dehydrorhamnose reductase [Phototrophicaceae bacterium]
MRIVITGAKGKLGSRLAHLLNQKHQLFSYGAQDLDISNFRLVKSVIQQIKPDIVINCAAWTDVDGCARDTDKAIRINGYGAQNLAIATNNVNAAILHVSSNEVFDGRGQRPYYEYDAMNPANPYGYSKMVGEKSVVAVNPRHYIVRTSWLFAHGGRNFIHAILDAAKAGKKLNVVVDEIANPTYSDDLADAIIDLISTERYGTYHLVNEGTVSRYNFARYFLDKAGLDDIEVGKISRYEWTRPSQPPVYSGLANHSARNLGIVMRNWQEAVDAFLEKENLLASET